MIRAAFLLLLLGVPGLASGAAAALPPMVSRAAASLGIAESDLSLWVIPLDATSPILEFNADTPRNPASTLKLVTTYAALQGLGPTYRWETEVHVESLDRDGLVPGDLWIRGTGDPHVVVEEFWKLAQALRDRGISRIQGDLVFDTTYFDLSVENPGEFDNQPDRVYNIAPHPFLVNFNAVRFRVNPTRDGQAVSVSAHPNLPNLVLANRLRLRSSSCRGYQRGVAITVQSSTHTRDRVLLEGRFPSGCEDYDLTRTVLQPESYAYGLFDLYWRQLGGELKGGWRVEPLPEWAGKPFYVHRSRPLGDLIRLVNKYSNNVMTRHLELTLGAERYGAPATFEKGHRAVFEVLRQYGVDTTGMVIDNSAGLSRNTQISARQLGQVLKAAWQSPFMPEFVSSLSLAGFDGTTRTRFQGNAGQGRMHLKTGRLDSVASIAGYVTATSNRRFAVVVLVNGPDAHRGLGEDLQEVVLDWVVAH